MLCSLEEACTFPQEKGDLLQLPTVSLMELLSATCSGFSAQGEPGVGTGWGKLEVQADGLGALISPVGGADSSQILLREIPEELQLEICYFANYP